MKDILTEIVEAKRKALQEQPPTADRQTAAGHAIISMSHALASSTTGFIAEFKRKSPSRGWIHQEARPTDVVPAYCTNGAAALSILTDEPYFGGSLRFIRDVRPLVDIPILRKDFIIAPRQLHEARQAGADAVLLIAACLERRQCSDMMHTAHDLGLEVLLEVHTADELEYVEDGVDMVGINNRNLGTFVTDVDNSFRLADSLREAVHGFARTPVLVSESGISNPETVRRLRRAGFGGFLMGETFMRAADPGQALKEFIEAL